MSRYLLIFLLLFSCGAVHAELTLKVMSFNVRYGTALDGENSWPKRKDILIDTLREYSPDVCGLQECLAFQADYIVEQLPEYRWIGVDRDVTGLGEMTAVIYKHDTFFPIESGHFWLSETPDVPTSKSWDTSLTRMTTWLRFHHPDTGAWFHFYNTHLDHRGAEARAQSVKMITAHAAHLSEDYPVILAGDFNAVAENSRPYEIALEAGYTDAWTKAETQVGPAHTFSAFKAPEPDKDARIDWILYRGPVRASHCETVTHNENGRYPSDHFPVHAVLHIATE